MDNPRVATFNDGPADPHIGYQPPGKRNPAAGKVKGHIILNDVPATRGRFDDPGM